MIQLDIEQRGALEGELERLFVERSLAVQTKRFAACPAPGILGGGNGAIESELAYLIVDLE